MKYFFFFDISKINFQMKFKLESAFILLLFFSTFFIFSQSMNINEEKIKSFEEWYKQRYPTAFENLKVDLNWTQNRPGVRTLKDFEVLENPLFSCDS